MRQELFNHLSENHSITATQSEMDDILYIVAREQYQSEIKLKNEISELNQQIAELKQDGWVSVEDGLPEKEGLYLVEFDERQYRDSYELLRFYKKPNIFTCLSGYPTHLNVTHWKPITPPEIK